MKNRIISCLCVLIWVFMEIPVFALDGNDDLKDYELIMYADGKVAITNGEMEVIDSIPFLDDKNNFMIPVRYAFEKLGYDLSNVSLTQNSNIAIIDGKEYSLKSNVIKKDDVLYAGAELLSFLGKNHKVNFGILAVGEHTENDITGLLDYAGIYVKNDRINGGGIPLSPVNSLEYAKSLAADRINNIGDDYPVYIFIHGGAYKFTKTLDFNKKIFGNKEKKGLSIEAYGDGDVIFTGAEELNINDFEEVTDAEILAHLPQSARGKVGVLDLRKAGISAYNTSKRVYASFFLNDKEQIISRWPNVGFSKATSVSGDSFGFEGVTPLRWKEAKEARIYGYFKADYFYDMQLMAGIDEAQKMIKGAGATFSKGREGSRYCVWNLLEEIDMPGEYFTDKYNMKIYYYPPYTLKNTKAEIITFFDTMLKFNECSNIEIKGINFDKSGGQVIVADGVDGLTVKDCSFKNMQQVNTISVANNSYNVIIDSNDFYRCGGTCVYIKSGDIDTLKRGNSIISNNYILDGGYTPMAMAGAIRGPRANSQRNSNCGVTVKNNLIQNFEGGTGITVEGAWCDVVNNEIINVGKNVDDGGAIYMGRVATLYGSEIAYNYMHDFNMENFFCGLYNDDSYAGTNWHHNICVNMPRPSINGLGMDMNFNYNIAYNCIYPQNAGNRMPRESMYGDNMKKEAEHVVNDLGEYYNEAFPQIKESLKREPYFAMWNTVFFGNVGVKTGGATVSGSEDVLPIYGGKTVIRNGEKYDITGKNGTNAGNPYFESEEGIFKDIEHQNYEINPESQLAEDYPELLEIKMDEIGLINPEKRLKKPEGFKLKYPSNGLKNVQAKEIKFSWDTLEGATKYRIVIARDRALTDIVIDDTIIEQGNANIYTVNGLDLNTIYYWKVYGIGLAKDNVFTIESKGDAYTFKTSARNVIDKEPLKVALDSVKVFLSQLNSGVYSFDSEYIALVKNSIREAEEIYKQSKKQNELNKTEEKLYDIVKQAAYYMTVKFDKLPDDFFKADSWSAFEGFSVTTLDNETLRVASSTKAGNVDTVVPMDDKIICFKMKYDSMEPRGYRGFYIKNSDGGYLVVFKDDIFEWQTVGKTLTEFPNGTVKPGVWHDVQIGAVNGPSGVLQFLRVDGQLLWANYDDSATQVRSGDIFKIRLNDKEGIEIRQADSIPEPTTLINEVIETLNNPESETLLADAITGMGSAINMNSTLYNAVKKTEIAQNIFNSVKDKTIQIDGTENYKNEVEKYTIIAGYNQGLEKLIYSDGSGIVYEKEIGYDEIDKNGVNLYNFYKTRLKDKDRLRINKMTLNGNYKSFDDIRRSFAKNVLEHSLNVSGTSFAGDHLYMMSILTKENADYIGINLDAFLALPEVDKEILCSKLSRTGADAERSLEEVLEIIDEYIREKEN